VLKERNDTAFIVETFNEIEKLAGDVETALELASDVQDDEFLLEAKRSLEELETKVDAQEFRRKMSGEFDSSGVILDINGGAGGTEAMDWASILMRMYTRWAERKGFRVQLLECTEGEEAGIKSATLLIEGAYAYGHLRAEQGVHRLVRISPFDSNARRHTSFASITITPDIEQDIDIVIEEKDLRIDTYRSSGSGGQHVNKTDSAIRLTHLPTGVVVACQNERSQHKNKDMAMRILKAKLYELKKQEQDSAIQGVVGERKKIDFGSQIRSYVMQPYQMVKDLRTDYETSSVHEVLDGDLDPFIEAYLLR
jgi:peptide chain release factor 2